MAMGHGRSSLEKSLNGTEKLLLFTFKIEVRDRGFNSLANNKIKLSVKY